jgi:hypothetical protein
LRLSLADLPDSDAGPSIGDTKIGGANSVP